MDIGGSITQKLLYVQQNLKAPKGQYNKFGDYHYRSCEDIQEALKPFLKAPKGQYNKFGDYHYRSCEDIQEALKPLLAEVKAILLLTDEIQQIGDRFYIKAAAVFQDTESDQKIVNIAYARECESRPKMDAAQITGSCSSYARKYALNGLFCIDDAKDPDTLNNGADPSGSRGSSPQNTTGGSRTGPTLVQQQHINTIRKEIQRTGAKEAAVCYQYKIRNLQEMTIQQFQAAMKIFRQMPDKMTEENYQMTLEGIDQYEDVMPFR